MIWTLPYNMRVITTICYDKQQTVCWIAQKKAHITFCTINTPSSSFTKSTLVLLFAKFWPMSDIIISNVGNRYRCWLLSSFTWQMTITFSFWRSVNSSLNGTRFCKSSCYHHGKLHQVELWLLWYFQLIAMTAINQPCIYFSNIYIVKQNLQIPSFRFYWCSVKRYQHIWQVHTTHRFIILLHNSWAVNFNELPFLSIPPSNLADWMRIAIVGVNLDVFSVKPFCHWDATVRIGSETLTSSSLLFYIFFSWKRTALGVICSEGSCC